MVERSSQASSTSSHDRLVPDVAPLDGRCIVVSTSPDAERGRRRALIVVNPASRSGKLGIDATLDLLKEGGITPIEATCSEPADVSRCIVAHRDEVDCVVLAGGDGTINAAARGLVETGLPLGLVPTGTANDFARSIGIPPDPEAAAGIIVEGRVHKVDVGDVNGHLFFNVASIGLAAELAKSLTSERKRRFGKLSYALTAMRLMTQVKPFHATILQGDEKVRVRTLQVAVGNGRFYGGGNAVAEDATIDDGYLDLYSLEFSQIWRMALMIPTFKAGAHGAVREVRTARGEAFEIVTSRPRSVNADGELVTKTPAVFTQLPSAVKVYVPLACPLLDAAAAK